MSPDDLSALIDRYFATEAVRDWAWRIATTPVPQTELYEREPLILKAIREMYRPAYEALGCDTWIDDYGNLVATQGSGTGRHVMFLSYAMAWTEGTMHDPWSGQTVDGTEFGVEGDVIWGRGGSEYHPTNAAMLECARIIHESEVAIPGTITYVVSSGGHTSSSDPVYHLILNDQLRPDLCIMPGTKKIVLGNMGRLDLRVNVLGKSVHSGGVLMAGTNAIEGGLLALRRLETIMPFPPGGTEDPDMGKGRLSVIGLASYPFSPGYHAGVGSGGHTLQNRVRFLLDRRLPPGQDVGEAIDEIKTAIGDLSPWRLTYERGALQYPWKHDPESEIVKSVAEAYSGALNREPEFGYIDFTIDAGYMNLFAGIPTVMFGAMDMRFAHSDADFTQLSEVYDIAKVYTWWALENSA